MKIIDTFISDTFASKLLRYNISKSIVSIVRLISFGLLVYVSLNLSVDLFKQLGGTQKDSSLFVITIIGIELSKTIAVILAKSEFHSKVRGSFKNVLGYAIFYLVLTAVSVSSSYGFVISATEYTATKNIMSDSSGEIKAIEGKILDNNTIISGYIPFLAKENLSLVSKTTYETKIQKLKEEIVVYEQELKALRVASASDTNKESVKMYDLIARDMGLDVKKVRFWMMMLLVFVIEGCITVMAPHINIIRPKKSDESIVEVTPPVKPQTTPSPPKVVEGVIPKPVSVKEIVSPPVETPVTSAKEKISFPQGSPIHEAMMEPLNIKQEKVTVEANNRETAFERFLKALYDNNKKTYLKEKELASKEANIPLYKAGVYFDGLLTTKGETGYPLIEYRKDGYYYANYTSQIILYMYQEGKLLFVEGDK